MRQPALPRPAQVGQTDVVIQVHAVQALKLWKAGALATHRPACLLQLLGVAGGLGVAAAVAARASLLLSSLLTSDWGQSQLACAVSPLPSSAKEGDWCWWQVLASVRGSLVEVWILAHAVLGLERLCVVCRIRRESKLPLPMPFRFASAIVARFRTLTPGQTL